MMTEGRTVVLNSKKMDYDGLLDFSGLSREVVTYFESTPEQILERIRGAIAVVTKELPLSAGLIASFPESVKLIVEAGTGYNNIDLKAAEEKGITVCNIPAYSSHRVAHTAIMLMLNLASSMQLQLRMLERGDRSNFTEHLQVPHTELNGKTLGVVGYGNIGRQVIRVAQAMDMRILCHTKTPRPDEENLSFVTLERLLKESDYVSLHCPLNEETRHLINEETLSLMRPSAFLINTSRGALVDEKALIRALKEGRLAGAGLDVQETEPPAEDCPLYTMENVIVTPHMGWKGLETRERLVGIVTENIRRFFEGHPINVVTQNQ